MLQKAWQGRKIWQMSDRSKQVEWIRSRGITTNTVGRKHSRARFVVYTVVLCNRRNRNMSRSHNAWGCAKGVAAQAMANKGSEKTCMLPPTPVARATIRGFCAILRSMSYFSLHTPPPRIRATVGVVFVKFRHFSVALARCVCVCVCNVE